MGSVVAIASAFNEASNLPQLIEEFDRVRTRTTNHTLRLVVVNNGSTDQTKSVLAQLQRDRPWLGSIELIRNFRMSGALLAGLNTVEADAYILMAADLQDHPDVIPDLLPPWAQGYSVVNVVVTQRKGSTLTRRLFTKFFYALANFLSRGGLERNVSDFRLVDRKVRDELLRLPEQKKFLRGTISWLGFPTYELEKSRPPRHSGTSKAGTKAMFDLAIRGIIYSTAAPLRFSATLGITASIVSLLAFVFFTVRALFFGVPFDGFGTIVSLIALCFSFQLLILGIIGEYLFVVFEESRARPSFIVRSQRIPSEKVEVEHGP